MKRGSDLPYTVLVPQGFERRGVPSVYRVRERVGEGPNCQLVGYLVRSRTNSDCAAHLRT